MHIPLTHQMAMRAQIQLYGSMFRDFDYWGPSIGTQINSPITNFLKSFRKQKNPSIFGAQRTAPSAAPSAAEIKGFFW